MDQILYLSTSDIKHHVHLQTIHTLMDIRANLADFKKDTQKALPMPSVLYRQYRYDYLCQLDQL